MRTRTIFEALRASEYRMRNRHFAHRERFYSPDREERRKAAQATTFERELLRRIEERDAIRPALTRISDAYHEWIVVSSPPEEAAAFGLLEAAIFDANTALGREDMFNS